MRWLFLFFIFLNIFFYIWQKQQTTTITQTVIEENLNIPTIFLLKEHPELAKPYHKEQDEPKELKTSMKEPLTCLFIGGFTNVEQLSVINTYLKKIDPNITAEIIKPTQEPKVELYITAQNTDQSATIEQLNKSSVNSLVILRGTLKGNVSLGIFSDENDYANIKEVLKDTDINIKTQKLVQSAPSYWLEIPNKQRALFSQEKLRDLIKNFPTAQQELMFCQSAAKNSN